MTRKNPSTWNEMALLTAAIKTKCSQVTVLSSLLRDTGRKRAEHPVEAAHIDTTIQGSKVTLQ